MKFIIPKQLKKNTSQISVVFTIIIAIIIVFVFLLINIAKISDIKTLTSQIADKEALTLASKMSTYVNKLWIQVQESVKVLGIMLPSPLASCEPVKCCAINWGLLLPLVAFVIGIVLLSFIVTLPVSLLAAGLTFGSMPFLAAEVNAIMKGTFSRIDSSPETGIRETSMAAMLAAIGGNFDPALADKVTDVNKDGISTTKFIAPMPGDPTNKIEYYIGKAHPFLEEVRNKKQVPRYVAWYWSKRYPLVGDEALATDMEKFISFLATYFLIEKWDTENWKILEASIVAKPVDISNTSSTVPKWVVQVPPADSWEVVRIVGPVSSKPGLFDSIVDVIDRRDFLGSYSLNPFDSSDGFVSVWKYLFERLRYPLNFTAQDIEDLRDLLKGVTVRSIEVLNLPINQRAVGLNAWWPLFWDPNIEHASSENKDDYKQKRDIWEKLKYAQLQTQDWINQLYNANEKLKSEIAKANGNSHTGIGSEITTCYTWYDSDDGCEDEQGCSWAGNYCSACSNGRPSSCDLGDLYKKKPFSYCNYPSHYPGCSLMCGSCFYDIQCPAVCEYMAEFSSQNPTGPTKLTQVIQIMARLNDVLKQMIIKIEGFQTRVDEVLNTPNIVKDIALYGWDDKRGGLHLAKVQMENYPAYKDFPYIKEYYADFLVILKGFLKCREVMNASGNITVGVSRYDTDVKTSMWNLKYRNKTSGEEFSTDSLKTLIQSIHASGNITNSTDIDSYMITSKTKGHYEYGPKHAITIEREK